MASNKLCAAFVCLALSILVGAHKERYIVYFRQGNDKIAVTVEMDLREKVAFLSSGNPSNQAVSFYDYSTNVIAFKDQTRNVCYLEKMKDVSLIYARRLLQSLRDQVLMEKGENLIASEPLLSSREILSVGGRKILRFCAGTSTYAVSELKSRARGKRSINRPVVRTYPAWNAKSTMSPPLNAAQLAAAKRLLQRNRDLRNKKSPQTRHQTHGLQSFGQDQGHHPDAGLSSQSHVELDKSKVHSGASAQGAGGGGNAQAQVQGSASRDATFQAQAQSGFHQGSAQSQTQGSELGSMSSSSTQVENVGHSQTQAQMTYNGSASQASAQTMSRLGSISTHSHGGHQGGQASSEAKGQGETSSSARVGVDEKDSKQPPFVGRAEASSNGGLLGGQSKTSVRGTHEQTAYSAVAQGSFGQTEEHEGPMALAFPEQPGQNTLQEEEDNVQNPALTDGQPFVPLPPGETLPFDPQALGSKLPFVQQAPEGSLPFLPYSPGGPLPFVPQTPGGPLPFVPQTPGGPLPFVPQTPGGPLQFVPKTPGGPLQFVPKTPGGPLPFVPQTPGGPLPFVPHTPGGPLPFVPQTPGGPLPFIPNSHGGTLPFLPQSPGTKPVNGQVFPNKNFLQFPSQHYYPPGNIPSESDPPTVYVPKQTHVVPLVYANKPFAPVIIPSATTTPGSNHQIVPPNYDQKPMYPQTPQFQGKYGNKFAQQPSQFPTSQPIPSNHQQPLQPYQPPVQPYQPQTYLPAKTPQLTQGNQVSPKMKDVYLHSPVTDPRQQIQTRHAPAQSQVQGIPAPNGFRTRVVTSRMFVPNQFAVPYPTTDGFAPRLPTPQQQQQQQQQQRQDARKPATSQHMRQHLMNRSRQTSPVQRPNLQVTRQNLNRQPGSQQRSFVPAINQTRTCRPICTNGFRIVKVVTICKICQT